MFIERLSPDFMMLTALFPLQVLVDVTQVLIGLRVLWRV